MNFLKIFCDSFTDNWDRPAITSYSTGLTLSYASLAARIERVNRLLELLKVTPGAHVGIVGINSIDWITNYMATMLRGYVAVTIQVSYNNEDVLSLLSSADTEILFIDPVLMPREVDFSTMPALRMVISQDTQEVLYCRFGAAESVQAVLDGLDQHFVNIYPNGFMASDISAPDIKPDAPSAIFFTAGTIGVPKPVVLSSDSMEGNIIFGIRAALFPHGSRTLTSSSVGNVWGTIFNVLVPLASGAHITVFNDFYNPEALIAALKVVKPRRVIMSPRQLRDTYAVIESTFLSSKLYRFLKMLPFNSTLVHAALRRAFNKATGGNCHEVVIGSSNVNRALKRRLSRVGIRFTVSYGLVECGGLVTYTPASEYDPATVGRPLENVMKCRLRPLELKGLPENVGILEVHGMTVMKGYYNDKESTREAFTSDGWLSTRDIATIDREGNISIVARLDSYIERPEGAIVPERIENLLVDMPGVKQVVLVDRDGVLMAIVHAHDGADADAVARNAIATVNAHMPARLHIDQYEISREPLDFTLKGTIARYRYF